MTARTSDQVPIARLRERVFNRHVLRGFGPLVVAAILIALMVIFVPTVAPERVTVIQTPEPVATTVPTASPAP